MNITFAKVTEYHETLEFQVTPCARFLYHWLLRNARAGTPQEIELEEFIAFTARGRSRPYSLRHVWRALKELFTLGVVDAVKEYTWKIWKVIAYHPLLAETSLPVTGTSQTEIKKSQLGHSNPHSVVPYYREFREHTDTVPTLPPVVVEESGQIALDFTKVESPPKTEVALPIGDEPETPLVTPCPSKNGSLDQTSQNSLGKVKELIAPQVLHQQLQKMVLETDLVILNNAIAVVRENQAKSHVKNPSGLLVRAIRGKWVPMEVSKPVVDEFKPWYENAYGSGLIERFTSNKTEITGQEDGVLCVMPLGKNCWVPWMEFRRSP